MTGATLVVADPGVHQDPARLIEVIVAERITTLHFGPSMVRAVVRVVVRVMMRVQVLQVWCEVQAPPR